MPTRVTSAAWQAVSRPREVAARWRFKRANGLRDRKQWAEAVTYYRAAIATHKNPPPEWHYRLGSCLERLRLWDDAKTAYELGLRSDPHESPADRAMLELETREWLKRRIMLRFVAEHLDEIRSEAAQSLASQDRSDAVYVYWAQGFDAAPDIVRMCNRRLKEHCSGTLVELDEPAMQELVRLPADIEAREIKPTHRSDLLRLELLARYGGSWLDATCLVTADPTPKLAALRAPTGYFAFAKRRATFASWVMSSVPDHRMVRMQRAALHTYWRHHDRLTDYFAMHHIFESLTRLDEEFGRLWDATPTRPYNRAFELFWHLDAYRSQEDFQKMLAGSFVHKLTYKYDPETVVPGSVLDRLLAIS